MCSDFWLYKLKFKAKDTGGHKCYECSGWSKGLVHCSKDIIASTTLVSAFLNFLIADSHASYINPFTKFSSLIKSPLVCQDLSPQKFSLFISKIRCHFCDDFPIGVFICLFLKKISIKEHIPTSIIHDTNREILCRLWSTSQGLTVLYFLMISFYCLCDL